MAPVDAVLKAIAEAAERQRHRRGIISDALGFFGATGDLAYKISPAPEQPALYYKPSKISSSRARAKIAMTPPNPHVAARWRAAISLKARRFASIACRPGLCMIRNVADAQTQVSGSIHCGAAHDTADIGNYSGRPVRGRLNLARKIYENRLRQTSSVVIFSSELS